MSTEIPGWKPVRHTTHLPSAQCARDRGAMGNYYCCHFRSPEHRQRRVSHLLAALIMAPSLSHLMFRGLLVSSRILVFASNVKRLYSQWSYRVLNFPMLSKGETYSTSDPIERTVSPTLCTGHLFLKYIVHMVSVAVHKGLKFLFICHFCTPLRDPSS